MVGDFEITGTLHYVSGYTGFASDDKQNGNFLALSFVADEDATLTVTFNNAQTTTSPVVLEPGDRDCVFRITNKDQQSLTVKVEKNGESNTKQYGLSGLTLEEAA